MARSLARTNYGATYTERLGALGKVKVNELGELSYTEIALVLDTTPETIRRIEDVAIKKLKMPKNRAKFKEILYTVADVSSQPSVAGLQQTIL